MPLFIIFILYNSLQLLFLPFLPLYLFIISRNRKVLGNLPERIGIIPKANPANNNIWFHAVSVGEMLSIQHMLETINTRIANSATYLTVGTVAAKELARGQVKSNYLSFIPYDFLPCVLIAFARIKPSALVLVEGEIWPNLLIIARWKKIPVYMVNARMSTRSARRYRLLGMFARPLLKSFKHIYAKNADSRDLFTSLGIDADHTSVLGELKAYNVMEKKKHIEREMAVSRLEHATLEKEYQTLLVGSVHEGEAQVYIDLFSTLKKDQPCKLILAPRHFHWRENWKAMLDKAGLRYKEWDNSTDTPLDRLDDQAYADFNDCDVIVVAKLGILFNLYPVADLFFLGGTFVKVGGHNLLEPTVWQVPTCVGPYHYNSQDQVETLLKVNAIMVCTNEKELTINVGQLLADKQELKAMGQRAYEWLEYEATRVEKALNELYQYLK
ncbi:MAG: hypothetical protein H6679_04280 [Epsilonproteobacteria bacterium]|nr:hypothetical protein [Campylobacterota bacterium]